jgi:hypothetical protein
MSDSGGTRYDWQHYIPLVQRKPGALRNGALASDNYLERSATTILSG